MLNYVIQVISNANKKISYNMTIPKYLFIQFIYSWGINLYVPVKSSNLAFFPGSVNLYIFSGCNLKILQSLVGDYQV